MLTYDRRRESRLTQTEGGFIMTYTKPECRPIFLKNIICDGVSAQGIAGCCFSAHQTHELLRHLDLVGSLFVTVPSVGVFLVVDCTDCSGFNVDVAQEADREYFEDFDTLVVTEAEASYETLNTLFSNAAYGEVQFLRLANERSLLILSAQAYEKLEFFYD